MKIFIVRHAQKDESQKSNIDEHYHRRLTSIGQEQAKYLGKYFSDRDIATIFSSDMARAVETAQCANSFIKAPMGVSIHPALREADPVQDPSTPNRDIIKIKCWSDWSYSVPGGESYEQGRARMKSFVEEIIRDRRLKDSNILIVSHGRVIRLFLSEYLENSHEVIKESYKHVAVTCLEINNDEISISIYNDNSYLPEEYRI